MLRRNIQHIRPAPCNFRWICVMSANSLFMLLFLMITCATVFFMVHIGCLLDPSSVGHDYVGTATTRIADDVGTYNSSISNSDSSSSSSIIRRSEHAAYGSCVLPSIQSLADFMSKISLLGRKRSSLETKNKRVDLPISAVAAANRSSTKSPDLYQRDWDSIWNNLLNITNQSNNYTREQSSRSISNEDQKMEKLVNITTTGVDVSSLSIEEVLDIFPPPRKASDIIEVYNQSTYQELIKTFVTQENVVICANGGSSTAGGGGVVQRKRYFARLADYLTVIKKSMTTSQPQGVVHAIDRGHGARHSLHTAVFSSNFIPANVDLLLWEFAINDYGYHIPDETRVIQERSIFLAWLQEVEKIKPKPPKVILIYLWRTPFQLDAYQKIDNPVFTSHNRMAKHFDFVVGHVNVASYFDDIPLPFQDTKQLFLADNHHPNGMGHLAISYLLLAMLRGGQSEWLDDSHNQQQEALPSSSNQQSKDIPAVIENFQWHCGNETEDKRFIARQVVKYMENEQDTSWRSPRATWSLESPQNTVSVGKRQIVAENALDVSILGKIDLKRNDRQGSIQLACCKPGLSSSSRNITTFKISNKGHDPAMKNIQSIFLGFGKNMSDVSKMKVLINEEGDFLRGKLIKVSHDWNCFWSWQDIYESMWFVLPRRIVQPQTKVASLQFCVQNKQCLQGHNSGVSLISMAVY